MRAMGRIVRSFSSVALVCLVLLPAGCKRKIEEMPSPGAPAESYYVTDSFETIYRALTNPEHTKIDRYNIWAAYRGKRVKWAAPLHSAESNKGSVQAVFAFVYDRDSSKLLGGAEALFEGEEGEKLLRMASPTMRIVFEGILSSYYFTEEGSLIIGLANAKVVDE